MRGFRSLHVGNDLVKVVILLHKMCIYHLIVCESVIKYLHQYILFVTSTAVKMRRIRPHTIWEESDQSPRDYCVISWIYKTWPQMTKINLKPWKVLMIKHGKTR